MKIISGTICSALVVGTLLGISSCSPSKAEQCASLRKIIDEPGKDKQTQSYYVNESKATKKAYEQLNLPDKNLDRIRKDLIAVESTTIESSEAMIEIEEKAKSIEKEIDRLEFEVYGQAPHRAKYHQAIDNYIKLVKEINAVCPSTK